MRRTLTFTLLTILMISGNVFASKPYEEWNREDVINYLENHNMVFEGEYKDNEEGLYILIGRLNSRTEEVNLNFFLREDKLVKASLITSQKGTFLSLNEVAVEEGFQKISESNDQLGNQYRKYLSGKVELNLVQKSADWPEVYFQP